MKLLVAALVCFSFATQAYDIPLLEKLGERTDGGAIPLTAAQEDATIQGIATAILSKIVDVRDAHPKAHACVASRFKVDENLAEQYQTGFFKTKGQDYPAIVRFSSGSSDPLADDNERGGQGMAVKFLLDSEQQKEVADIPGERYFQAKDFYKTFDIITITALKEWIVNDLASYGDFLKAAAKVGAVTKQMKADKKPGWEIAAAAAGIMYTDYVSALPITLQPQVGALILKIGAAQTTNILQEEYNSWVPYAFDENRAVKYSWQPCANRPAEGDVGKGPNFLSDQLLRDLQAKGGGELCFELYAQFHQWWHPSVENPSLAWVANWFFPDVRLGRLTLSSNTYEKDFCDSLSFNPGHALPNQRGVGSTQRARRVIYAAVETRRNENKGRKEIK